MNDAAPGILSLKSRRTSLALASVVVWLAAVASTGPLGIWSAVGGAAVALGLAVLLFDRPAATTILQPSLKLVLLGAICGVSSTVACRRVACARTRHRRRRARLAKRRADLARSPPWSLGRRHAGSGCVCAGARAPRIARSGGGRAVLRARVGRSARHDRESRANSCGSPAVERARAALAASGHQMNKEGAPNASRSD